ncbi:unnamed protein product [Allacma fusca]|uniref:Uncharacterized protein n=1 Tax=Allacma fusca TaxID=39272 RepID=A0A8J2PUF0_9HEXA|nr:unnamed protein product [Allacma fusca]
MEPSSEIFFILIVVFGLEMGTCKVHRKGKVNTWDSTLIIGLNKPMDMKQFLIDSYAQMGDIDCATVVWDRDSAPMLGSVTFCLPHASTCAHKYIINYDGGEISERLVRALKAGYQEQCGGYVILLKSPKAVMNLLHQGDHTRMINTRARFLIWYQEKDLEFEKDYVWKKIPNVIFFNTSLNTRTRHLSFTVLQLRWPVIPEGVDGSEPRIHAIDFWRHGKGLKTGTGWYYDKTRNLKNITLKILVVEHPPGVIKYKSAKGEVEYAGVEVDLVNALKDIMTFQIEFVDADAVTKWGGKYVDEDNATNFYGAVGRLIYGETDLAIGSFFILKHYLNFIDMSIPLDVACTSFLTPTPLARPRYLALILPFNYQLWILVFLICFIFAPLGLYGLTHLKYHIREYHVFSEKIQVVLTSFRIMSQVALHIWPKHWPVRMFIGWYWLFTLLITLAYRGAMVSFLTIPLFEKPIDNINELYASGLRLGGWGSELHKLFTHHQAGSKESEIKALLSNKYEIIDNLENGISMVAAGGFALFENVRFLKFIRQTRNQTKSGAPSMRIMKQCIVPVHIGIAYQKNSPFTRTINGHIRRFRESGLTKKWGTRLIQLTKDHDRAKFQRKSERDGNEEQEGDGEEESNGQQRKQRVLTMADLQGSVYLILFGVFVSVIAFIFELTIVHVRRATQSVNKGLKKIVDQTVTKTKGMIDDRKFLLEYEAQFQNKLRKRKKNNKKRSKKLPPFPYID